jgi:hypothetical protein
MDYRTWRLTVVAGVCAVVAAVAAVSPKAVSAKPAHAATTDSGVGCFVADANGDYTLDPGCTWHIVTKLDNAENLQIFSYQDHGTLPEGAPRPKKTRHNAVSVEILPGVVCTGTEVTMPSGEYKSDCHYSG